MRRTWLWKDVWDEHICLPCVLLKLLDIRKELRSIPHGHALETIDFRIYPASGVDTVSWLVQTHALLQSVYLKAVFIGNTKIFHGLSQKPINHHCMQEFDKYSLNDAVIRGIKREFLTDLITLHCTLQATKILLLIIIIKKHLDGYL